MERPTFASNLRNDQIDRIPWAFFFNIIQSPKVHVHCLVITTVKSVIMTYVFSVDKKVNGGFAINHVIIYARICTLTLRFLLLCLIRCIFYKTALLETTNNCMQYYKVLYIGSDYLKNEQ